MQTARDWLIVALWLVFPCMGVAQMSLFESTAARQPLIQARATPSIVEVVPNSGAGSLFSGTSGQKPDRLTTTRCNMGPG